MPSSHPGAGFTLVEIMISLTVLGMLLMLGLPSFSAWIQNTQIRTSAESLLNGLQVARAEAVRQNVTVQFVLGAGTGWTVSTVATSTVVQSRSASEGSGNAALTVSPAGATTVTFSGLGRVIPNPDASNSVTQIDVCGASSMAPSDMRKMRVAIGAGGNVRMCDLQVTTSSDPRACVGSPPGTPPNPAATC
jgi:type IV fimbrial biogenesis protein FimT